MFTGIVEETGVVEFMGDGRLKVAASTVMGDLRLGASIAVNGVCLTVATMDSRSFSSDVVPETLRRSNLGLLRRGQRVNLERALAASDRLGGHIVQGHVDCTATVASVTHESGALPVRFMAPTHLMRYVVEKGFVAVDGVSLTVVDCGPDWFSVTIIPFTRDHTALGNLEPGGVVNIEVDILAKYVERLASFLRVPGSAGTESQLVE